MFSRDIALDGDLYMRRWYLMPSVFGWRLMLHRIVRPDKDRSLHCHPWAFWTLCLRGGYLETYDTPQGEVHGHHVSFQLKHRPATFKHRIDRILGDCWTLVLHGPRRRKWGFYDVEGFREAEDQ